MKFTFCFLLLILTLSYDFALGKIYTRCGFAKELHGHGMTPREIATWTCIAEYTTGFNTSAIRGPFDKTKSKVHGPFLISDQWWCSGGGYKRSKNLCKTSCRALRSSKVSASINCARKIYQQQGYEAWEVWTKNCDGKLPNLDKCLN